MPKTPASQSKIAKLIRTKPKRKTAAQKFRELPLKERQRRLEAFFEDVHSFWKDKPSTGIVDFLIKSRRGGL